MSAVVQAKEETWTYATPELEVDIAHVGIGIDGTCMLMCEGQWREAMTGSISLYDRAGERQHTIYVGAAPEHGKASFYERMEREVQTHLKADINFFLAKRVESIDTAQSSIELRSCGSTLNIFRVGALA